MLTVVVYLIYLLLFCLFALIQPSWLTRVNAKFLVVFFFFIFDGTLLFPSVFNCSLMSRLGSVSSGDQNEVVHVSFQWCINGQCVFDTAAPSVERMSPPFITPPPSSTDIPPLSLSVCLLDCVHHRNWHGSMSFFNKSFRFRFSLSRFITLPKPRIDLFKNSLSF